MRNITTDEVLDIREANRNYMLDYPIIPSSGRYGHLAKKFNRSEWAIRWICQGREYKDIGGYIEDAKKHNSSNTRAISDTDALRIREDFYRDTDLTMHDLSIKYRVSIPTIERLLMNKTYRDVGGPICTNPQNRNNQPKLYAAILPKSTSPATVSNPNTVCSTGCCQPKIAVKGDPASAGLALRDFINNLGRNLYSAAQDIKNSYNNPVVLTKKQRFSKVDLFLIKASYKAGMSQQDLSDRFDATADEIKAVLGS